MRKSQPVRLRIPGIDLDSSLMSLGLQADGTLAVPPGGFPAGWFTGAPTPGEQGPAIIVGHVHWGGAPGVFWDLHRLSRGDEVLVTRKDRSVAVFGVRRVERVAKVDFPTDRVYGHLDYAGLRLITCGGFNEQTRTYDDNILVFADLIRSRDR
jgi:sortase (surface protein transpeptidase)